MGDGLPPDLVQLRSTPPIRALVLGIVVVLALRVIPDEHKKNVRIPDIQKNDLLFQNVRKNGRSLNFVRSLEMTLKILALALNRNPIVTY